MLPTSLTNLILPLLDFILSNSASSQRPLAPSRTPLGFELRHFHSTSGANVYFQDAPSRAHELNSQVTYHLNARPVKTFKPPSFDAFSEARVRSFQHGESTALGWEEDEVLGPDVESRETLLTLAKMTNNAYLEPGEKGWYDMGANGTNTMPVGWEPDDDGFRGYVFATPDNSTVVLAIKGTSASFVGGGGPTTRKDKLNDNLLFSCCCARVDWTWSTVCGCYRGGYKCNQDCVEQALIDDSLFYPVGTNLYNNLTYIYPDSNIWIIGHSLGGSLASLLGATFGTPVVAFEAPAEKLAAQRLHLPIAPSLLHITNVFHTADPIPMGVCTGVLSSCALGGYALETQCHLGGVIRYDTVSNASWAVDIRTHSINNVIEKLLSDPWPPAEEVGREVPEALPQDDCVDCYNWEFGNFTNSTA